MNDRCRRANGIPTGVAFADVCVSRPRARAAFLVGLREIRRLRGRDHPRLAANRLRLTVVRRDGWIESTDVKGVWVVRQPGNQYTVYNGRCTHLGCAYSWQPDQQQFTCPCHAGVYGMDGKVLAGPPPRPLDALQTRVESGQLQAQYQDFRLGTPEQAQA